MEVVVLTDGPEHVSYRYRYRQYAPFLADMGVRLRPVRREPSIRGRWRQCKRLPAAEVCVIQRKLLDSYTLRLLRQRYPWLVYDFDDAVVFRDSHSPKGPYSARRATRFRRTVRTVDVVIAGNTYLAGLALASGARQVTMIPTCVDAALYPPRQPSAKDALIRCVWIGSASTLPYLESLRPVFESLQHVCPRLVLRVICDRFPSWSGVRIERCRWSAAGEIGWLLGADIGVAPLPEDPWTAGKCGLKVLQYMAASLPVVASNTGVHPELVVHGVTGLLVRDESEWIEAIRTLVSDPKLRRQMGEYGRARVVTTFDVRRWVSALIVALDPGVCRHGNRSVA